MQERCDVVVGSGETFLAAGRYKDGDTVKYKFGIKMSLPEFTTEIREKIFQTGLHRVMSVKAAGIFNEANAYGTAEDAENFAAAFSGIDGWTAAFEKTRTPGEPKDTLESLINRNLVFYGKKKTEQELADLGLPEVPKKENNQPNWAAWAKAVDRNHAWVKKIRKKLESDL
jgi:hypothetical protein